MDKLSIPSASKDNCSIITVENSTSWDLGDSTRRLFYTTVSQLSVFFIKYHQRKLEKYKQTITNLEHQSKKYIHTSIDVEKIPLPISKEILEAVQLKLHAFETQKLYLNQDLSLSSLAKLLGTNSSYLSKIINHNKGKSFKHYLNDMRIEHAYHDLRANSKKRKFTIEAIAFDSGFKSAESFSKKFKEKYSMYPSAFLKSLKA